MGLNIVGAPAIASPAPLPPERPAIAEPKNAKELIPAKTLFAAEKLPSLGKAMAIGYYPSGCLSGAVELPVNGPTWQIFQYKPCTALPPDMRVLHGEAVTLLRAFDPAVALCRAGSEACLEALFKAADKNPDGKLNTAEWSRVLRLAAYLSVGASDDANEGEVAGALAVGLPLAPVIAASIIASYDYNGNGGTNPYGMDFETGVATISCYDIIGSGGTNKCGSSLAFAETIPGIDFDAAFPLAYWPKAVYGNCDKCHVNCSGSWGPSSVLQYDGQPLCYNITSRSTSTVKTIRVVDSCGR